MGYYVDIIDSNIYIKKEDFDAIYKLMCELNDHDELKRGGSSKAGEPYEGRYNPNKWFSWMHYNYPEVCNTLEDILTELGFEIRKNDDGDITSLGYSNKSGNEEYFLACFAGFTPDGSYIEFSGEEPGDYFRFRYEDGSCFFEKGVMTVDYNNGYMEEMIPCQITESDKRSNAWLEQYRKELAEKANTTA